MSTRQLGSRVRITIWVAAALGTAAFVSYLAIAVYQREAERNYRHQGWAVRRVARINAIEESTVGGDIKLFVRPAKGPILFDGKAIMCGLTNSPYIWKAPPPNGQTIPIDAESAEDEVFFACSASSTSDGRRSFVFPSPINHRILFDSQVDWETQRLKADD